MYYKLAKVRGCNVRGGQLKNLHLVEFARRVGDKLIIYNNNLEDCIYFSTTLCVYLWVIIIVAINYAEEVEVLTAGA